MQKPSKRPNPSTFIAKIKQAHGKKPLTEVLALVEEALRECGPQHYLLFLKGRLLIEAGRNSEGLEVFEQSISADPQFPWVRYEKAKRLAIAHDHLAAAKEVLNFLNLVDESIGHVRLEVCENIAESVYEADRALSLACYQALSTQEPLRKLSKERIEELTTPKHMETETREQVQIEAKTPVPTPEPVTPSNPAVEAHTARILTLETELQRRDVEIAELTKIILRDALDNAASTQAPTTEQMAKLTESLTLMMERLDHLAARVAAVESKKTTKAK